jgi:hypothetical protein
MGRVQDRVAVVTGAPNGFTGHTLPVTGGR